MKKPRNKRPDSYDTRWINFVMSKEITKKPETSHHKAFALGYLCGREKQRYEDSRILSCEIEQLENMWQSTTTDIQKVLLYKLWKEITERDVIDRYIKGYV